MRASPFAFLCLPSLPAPALADRRAGRETCADESFAARISTRTSAGAPTLGEGAPTSAAALPGSVAMPVLSPPVLELGAEPTRHLALDATAPAPEFRAPSPLPEGGADPSALEASPATGPVTTTGELTEPADSAPAPDEPMAASTSGPAATDRELVATSATGPAATDRERRLQLEVERLRSHIMAREEAFTHEVLQQDAQLQALREELEAARARVEPVDPGLAESHDSTVPGRPRRQDDAERDAQAVANLQSVIEMLQAGKGARGSVRERMAAGWSARQPEGTHGSG